MWFEADLVISINDIRYSPFLYCLNIPIVFSRCRYLLLRPLSHRCLILARALIARCFLLMLDLNLRHQYCSKEKCQGSQCCTELKHNSKSSFVCKEDGGADVVGISSIKQHWIAARRIVEYHGDFFRREFQRGRGQRVQQAWVSSFVSHWPTSYLLSPRQGKLLT